MTIESIRQGLEKLDELPIEEVKSLLASAYETFDQADKADDVDTAREALNAARSIKARQDALVASTATLDAPVEAEAPSTPDPEPEAAPETVIPTATEVPGVEPNPEGGSDDKPDPAVEGTPEGTTEDLAVEPEATAPKETPTEEPKPEDEAPSEDAESTDTDAPAEQANTDEIKEDAAMTASAELDIKPPADAQPVAEPLPATIVASADVEGFAPGAEFKSPLQVAEAMTHKIEALRGVRSGDGQKHPVVSIKPEFPEERTLNPGDMEGNRAKIQAAVGEEALVASGGFCAPLPVRYDIYGLGSAARPVRDALGHFQSSRGGLRYVAPPVLGDLDAAVSLWTAANDANPGSDGPATKPHLVVNCQPEQTAMTDAVTLYLQFGNFMGRAFPELVSRNNELALVTFARFAELNLLSQLTALSTAVTAPLKLGVGRDFLTSVGTAAAAYRNRHRVPRTTGLRVIAPEWVLDAMREDFAQGLPGDTGLAYADTTISNFLQARNIRISWHMDGVFAAQGPGALVDFPATFQWYMFSEGTFLFLDGGRLDLGVVRDSDLVNTNDYRTFTETWEGVAKIGVESLVVTQPSVVEGAVVGTVAPVGIGS